MCSASFQVFDLEKNFSHNFLLDFISKNIEFSMKSVKVFFSVIHRAYNLVLKILECAKILVLSGFITVLTKELG